MYCLSSEDKSPEICKQALEDYVRADDTKEGQDALATNS